MRFLILLVAVAVMLPTVQAIQLGENLYISLPPETVQCVNIQLPDDAGVFAAGLLDYQLTSNANWGDLTSLIVTTDENNTVRVPLCFSSFNREEGDCSNTYSLGIEVPEVGASQSYGGGVCVSTFPDVDYASPAEGESPLDVLNNNADLFDLGFRNPLVFGEQGEFTLLVQSYAAITLDLTAKGLSPSTQTITLSPENPKVAINFTASGQGEVSVTGKIRDCEGSFCSKKTKGEVRSTLEEPDLGFSATLFPLSLNVKELDPVTFELTIINYGNEKEFNVEFALPLEMESTFEEQNVIISEEGRTSIELEVTPLKASKLYLLTMIVTSDDNKKHTSSTLSTNELLTDALREGEAIKQQNPEKAVEVDNTIDSWYESYKTKEYGEGLGEYAELKESLDAMKTPLPDEPPVLPPPPIPEPPPQQDYTLFMIIGVIAAVGIVVVFFFMKKKPKKEINVKKLDEGF